MDKDQVVGLIPAAGLGRRAGQPKAGLILDDDPRPLLIRCIEGLRRAGAHQIVTIVREEHRVLAESAHAIAVVPPTPTQSMIESILAGLTAIEHADTGFTALMLCPVDSARAAEVAYTWIDQAKAAHPFSSIVPEFGKETGHPAWLPRHQWTRLRSVGCLKRGARAALEDAQRWRVDDSRVLDNVNELP